jgi:5,10-methylenetetrahydromethanopterin reductase
MKPAQRPLLISPRESTASQLISRSQIAEQLGVDQLWLEQQPDQRDAAVTANAYLTAAPTVTVGTAVLPMYARHPVAMAQAAATLSDFSGGRFILGVGISHRFINEYVLGYQQGPPIAVAREYLKIVRTLLEEGVVSFEGQFFTAHAQYVGPLRPAPIFLAALRPQMIRLGVEQCDGIVLWLCTARYVRERVMPVVCEACDAAGKDENEFSVITLLPSYSGSRADELAAKFRQSAEAYRLLPYYRYVLDAFGTPRPEELSLIGTREQIQSRMAEFRDAGCIPVPSPMGDTAEEFAQTVEAAYGA